MRREEMADMTAFVVVAEERNFTRAAAKLGLSQSALSQIVRRLEARLGIRLLTRTTRSVAPTQAGERLVQTLSPMLYQLDQSIDALSEFRDKPAGTIRITTVEHAAKTVLCPALAKLLPTHPDITIEIIVDYGLADVVADRFDAGVRLGEQVAKDMIAVRIAPDIPMAIVGSPEYFERHPAPRDPQQLIKHRCINLRLPTSGALNGWRLIQNGREIRVQVEGPLVFNTIDLILDTTLDGLGLAYLPLDQVDQHISGKRLKRVLDKWTPPLPGYHLYYPSRHHNSPAFKLLVDTLRYRSTGSKSGSKNRSRSA
ncbi:MULTISPECIES: LysR family transcriptional regulator [Bradyrhizobium]|uniref:LysR family transcriptional regulator n=1 Tax=Bradyrhizobium elkanii TaxID=29448 RepID=A0A4U6S5K2_BRAEL|nr:MULTISPECIES: LysR family transcriptional regulator [Bradyrhizobium]MTV12504.1 LysR family transcriptional regulator [Bradyrhizobium sp. BR2003]TKV82213.1 LysR family transcriptional regulator [Bradyrhizobium elkanii]